LIERCDEKNSPTPQVNSKAGFEMQIQIIRQADCRFFLKNNPIIHYILNRFPKKIQIPFNRNRYQETLNADGT